MSHAATYLIS